jgi:hypothetical protein
VLLYRGELAVDEGVVGERPAVLDWLEFGRGGRQEQQMDAIRHAALGAGVPAGPIQDEHNLIYCASPEKGYTRPTR